MSDRERLRATFDEDAELYDRARPGYPERLIADLWELARLDRGSRVLEIGPGTGQATEALVSRGARVVAVELGARLASVARAKLPPAPEAEIVVANFESWPLPDVPFDAVVAFTAWHWLDPEIRSRKAAAALRPGGALATVATDHVAGGTEDFFVEVQDCYERWDPTSQKGLVLPRADAVPPVTDELDEGPLFEAPAVKRYQWEATYSAEEYVQLLRTYSGNRALSARDQEKLLACIESLIERSYGGSVTKRYLNELRIARRASQSRLLEPTPPSGWHPNQH